MRVPTLTAISKYCLIVILTMLSLAGFSQACDPDAPAVSVYGQAIPGKNLAGGAEAGYLGAVHPFGYFAGIRLSWQGMTEPAHETSGIKKMDVMFYLKGLYRIVRKDDVLSLYLVATPEINLDYKFGLRGGVSILLPLSPSMAAQTEFLWGSRHRLTAIAAGLVLLL